MGDEVRDLERADGSMPAPDDLVEAAERRTRRKQARRRVGGAVVGITLTVAVVPLVWGTIPASSPGGADGAWIDAGAIDELRARRIVYLDEIETFVVLHPGEEPLALSASSPHLGERLLFCRTSGWFFSPTHGEAFDVGGIYELGPGGTGMTLRRTRIVDDRLEVQAGSESGSAARVPDPEPSGPSCLGDASHIEDDPGFAIPGGALNDVDRYPLDIVEGVTPGAIVSNPGFVGMEVGFQAPEIVVRLVGVDGSILDEQIVRCDPGPCPGYASADLIFTVDAIQRAAVLIGIPESDSVVWVHYVPVVLDVEPGVEPGSFVGTWYDGDGNPTYFRDADGWHLTLHVINGAEHCGWQSASFLTVGWPIGTEVGQIGDGDDRFYVRDPEGVLAESFGVPPPDLAAELPSDAQPTGYHRGDWELWTSPGDVDQAIYLVSSGGAVERWPRVYEAIACA